MPTYQTYAAKGLRESLADFIDNISPEDRPITSTIGKGKARATYEEWQTDVNAAANPANAAVEGADATNPTITPTTRLGNYTQISTQDFVISKTMEAVDKAGRASEVAYQTMKKGVELKNDVEAAVSQNSAAVAGNSTTARRSAGLETFAWEVNSHGGGTPVGSTTTVTAGAPTTAPVDAGTTRAFTESLLKGVLQTGFDKGVRYKMMVVGAAQKVAASGFGGLASTRLSVSQGRKGQGAIVGAADIYISDFGDISIVPSPFVRAKTALLLAPDHMEVRWLRPINKTQLAATGDAEKHQIIGEWTLVVKNPRAVAKVADLT